MTKIKKLVGLVLSFVLMLSLCTFAFAADTKEYTITITNTTTEIHTYQAYQVFAGDLFTDEDGNKILSNIEWGAGVNATSLLAALDPEVLDDDFPAALITGTGTEAQSVFHGCTTAREVAEVIAEYLDNSAAIQAIAEIIGLHLATPASDPIPAEGPVEGVSTATITVTGAGYYFIKDVTIAEALKYDTLSDYILRVVDDVTAEAKDSNVTVDKQVADTNDSYDVFVDPENPTTLSGNGDDHDTADWDIGDDVPFLLSATLPDNYTSFKQFVLTFNDTISKGLSVNENSIVVYAYRDNELLGTFAKVSAGYTVGITDYAGTEAAYQDGHVLTVSFADLMLAPLTAPEGAEQSDDPITLQGGDVIYVYYTAELNEDALTTEDGNPNKVSVTYSIDPNHTGEGDPTNDTPEDPVTVFTYRLNVNKVDDDGDPLAGAKFTLYKYDAEEEDWVSVGAKEATGNATDGYTATWNGLDDGIYKLVETTTPAGYNTAADVYFEIVATHIENTDGTTDVTLTVYGGTFDADGDPVWTRDDDPLNTITVAATVLNTNIVNEAGSVLPSTGGTGRTLIYIIGGVLVVTACVLFVVKRRKDVKSSR